MSDFSISRRKFVVGSGAALGTGFLLPNSVLAATRVQPSALSSGTFPTGVLSGDPSSSSITLIAKVANVSGNGGVGVEIATSSSFAASKVVKSTKLPLTETNDFTVKTTVTGLKPYKQYYYRFFTKNNNSIVGKFRTLPPAGSKQALKFAFFSCQDYTFGYYNAHKFMALEDLDFVVNLGDYIYSETYHKTTGADWTGVRSDGIGSDTGNGRITAVTEADYRAKYELYRSDTDLQAMHAAHAMFSTWDDHEVIDNYAGSLADGGLPASHGYTRARQATAYKVWFEKMPHRPVSSTGSPTTSGTRIYKKVSCGKTMDLFILDERQYRADQPGGDPGLADPSTVPGYTGPRKFLGDTQLGWLKSELKKSTATWKVIANEVMIMNTKFTSTQYYNFDSWQGYPAERADLINFIGGATGSGNSSPLANVVFVTGDIHTFAAGDVVLDPASSPGSAGDKAVATEFVAGSISSQGLGDGGLGEALGDPKEKILEAARTTTPKTDPGLYAILFGANRWLANGDTDHHGYGVARVSSTGFSCDLKRVSSVKTRSGVTMLPTMEANKATNTMRGRYSWTVAAGLKRGTLRIRDAQN